MLNVKFLLSVACLTALCACQKTNVSGISDARTVDYFSKNPEIAKDVAKKCLDFERKEYSKLSTGAQKEWEDSTDGINCRNSKQAASWIIWNEGQRRFQEADRMLSIDAEKK